MCSSDLFRSAKHQARDYSQIHLLARIVKLGLQNLRVIELFLQSLHRRRSRLPAEKNLYGPIQRRFWIRGRLDATHLAHADAFLRAQYVHALSGAPLAS